MHSIEHCISGDLDTQNTLNVMDLLIKLNQEDGITMVMVTHDTNLKNAADRVVYMRDGKIHRIEELDSEVKIAFRKSVAEQNASALGRGQEGSGKSRFTSATVKRRPQDYQTYDHEAVGLAHSVLDEFGKRKLKYETIDSPSNQVLLIPGTKDEPTITTVNPILN